MGLLIGLAKASWSWTLCGATGRKFPGNFGASDVRLFGMAFQTEFGLSIEQYAQRVVKTIKVEGFIFCRWLFNSRWRILLKLSSLKFFVYGNYWQLMMRSSPHLWLSWEFFVFSWSNRMSAESLYQPISVREYVNSQMSL